MKVYKQKNYRESKFNSIKKSVVFVFILVMLMLPIFVVVNSTIKASHIGSELRDIEDKISQLQTENRKLEGELVKESSLFDIYSNIDKFELKKAEKAIYIQKENSSVAQLPF